MVKKTINNILKTLRNDEITALHGVKCVKKEDYINGLHNMPGQDLLKFYFEDGSWFAVRASGTEPKIKYYYNVVSQISEKDAEIKQGLMHKDLVSNYLIFTKGEK